MKSRNPWSYKIDYAAEIAKDEALIAAWEQLIAARLFASCPGDRLLDVVVLDGGWQRLGLTEHDAMDLRDEYDYENVAGAPTGTNAATVGATRHNADRVIADMESRLPMDTLRAAPTEAEAKIGLRRAKADRARHLRNREKYEG